MGGDEWWSRWWVPEAGNGQQSSQADALHLGDPAVMGLGFTVESQFLRDLKMTKRGLIPRELGFGFSATGKLAFHAGTGV